MERTTEKTYCGYDIKDRKNFNGYTEEDAEKIFKSLQKLGQLEDFEEIIEKIRIKPIYIKNDLGRIDRLNYTADYYDILYNYEKKSIYIYESAIDVVLDVLLMSEYGKTWALTKEELEK